MDKTFNHLEELKSLDPCGNILHCNIRKEMPTPHRVVVLILIQHFLKSKRTCIELSIKYSVPARINFCLLLLKLIQYPDMAYNDLHYLITSPRYKIDQRHLDGFEKFMSDLFKLNIEVLLEFSELQNIEELLSEALGVSQFSIVGLYVRRVGVVLERLSFPQMKILYRNICFYYENGIHAMSMGVRRGTTSCIFHRLDSPDSDIASDDTIEESVLDTDTLHQDREPYSKWSLKQADLFVSQQCNLLEKNELRALSPIEMQKKVEEIIHDNPLSSQAYFLGYMNHLRLRDCITSRRAMHRAFDRCPNQLTAHHEQKGFQFFDLNLAVFHACFNHRKEALFSLKECIMLAQESEDKRCLDLANTWYCLLNSNTIDPFEKSLPDMHDPGLVESLSLAIQFVVKFGAQCGYLPLDLFELLMKSDELNNKNFIVEQVSDSLALRSALWSLYGRHEMSALYAQSLLNLRKTWPFGDVGNMECLSKVLASLSLWLNIQGEHHISAVLLDHARQRFPRYPNASNWMISDCLITIQQSIYQGYWDEALAGCCQLYLLNNNAGNLQRATVYVARGYFNMARRVLNTILKSNELDLVTLVRILVLRAYTTMGGDSLSSETVSLLMNASVLSQCAFLQYEQATADMVLAIALLLMNLPDKALQAATNCMNKIYINGGLYDQAKMAFIFVRCLVATAKTNEEKKTLLLGAIPTLNDAEDKFMRLRAHAKVLDVYKYIAKIFDELGEEDLRNKYACKFRQYYLEFPTAPTYLGIEF